MPPLSFQHAVWGLIMGPLGMQELLIILLIALLIFGGRKIPEIFKGLGEGIREFKSSLKGEEKKEAQHTSYEEKKEAQHTS